MVSNAGLNALEESLLSCCFYDDILFFPCEISSCFFRYDVSFLPGRSADVALKTRD